MLPHTLLGTHQHIFSCSSTHCAHHSQTLKVALLLNDFVAMMLQAYDPQLQLHTLLYDDGDLEQLNLCEEQWELLQQQAAAPQAAGDEAACDHEAASAGLDSVGKTQQQQQQQVRSSELLPAASDSPTSNSDGHGTHALAAGTADSEHTGMAAAATAAPAAAPDAMDVDSEGRDPNADHPDDNDAAWLAAAGAAAAERPLRVMWDSHACVMRVIAAADLVAAELEMRRQQRQHQQRQQHQQLDLWYDCHDPGGCRPESHLQQGTSNDQPPLLPSDEEAWAAQQQHQQQHAALTSSFGPAATTSPELHLQRQHWQQQQQQKDTAGCSLPWHCSAAEEAAPLLPQLLTGPAALGASSSGATMADRQPDEQVRQGGAATSKWE
jgi:hypothetical protein